LPEVTFDVVVANILANPLRVLAPVARGTHAAGDTSCSPEFWSPGERGQTCLCTWFDLPFDAARWVDLPVGSRRHE
jgi:hypothetical protein